MPSPVKDNVWHRSPDTVKQFIEQRPLYQELCDEVAEILDQSIDNHNSKAKREEQIIVSSISSRVKTLASFVEKIERKGYSDPLNNNTDFAGVRVVCLFSEEVIRLGKLVHERFEVLDSVSKGNELRTQSERDKSDRFGYQADHYIVRLKKDSSGIRFDNLSHLKCEIQIRTILQDSWAIVQHHLTYKQEDSSPPEVRRAISRLAALLEIGDEIYGNLNSLIQGRTTALAYEAEDNKKFLEKEIFIDSLRTYLEHLDFLTATPQPDTFKIWQQTRSPGSVARPLEYQRGQFAKFHDLVHQLRKGSENYKCIGDINKVLIAEKERILKFIHEMGFQDTEFPAVHFACVGLALADPDFRNVLSVPESWQDKINEMVKAGE